MFRCFMFLKSQQLKPMSDTFDLGRHQTIFAHSHKDGVKISVKFLVSPYHRIIFQVIALLRHNATTGLHRRT